jgi:hypothetical protein
MDGRSKRKVNDYLSTTFGARNIDTITTAGAVRHLAVDTAQTPILLANLAISIDKHRSRQIAIAAHADCAGNPVSDKTQKDEIGRAVRRIAELHPGAEVIGIWLDRNLIVERVARA